MSRYGDGFPIADIDTKLWDDIKVKRLVRQMRDETATLVAIAYYISLILESWRLGERLILADAAPAWSTADLAPVEAALARAGLVDEEGRIPEHAWESWYGPAVARRAAARLGGQEGNRRRWHPDPITTPSAPDSEASTSRSASNPRIRIRTDSTETSRARPSNGDATTGKGPVASPPTSLKGSGDPRPLAEILGEMGLDPDIPKRGRS